MTLYIACESDSGARVVRLEGWLEGEAVAEFERVVSGGSGPLRLDLSELRSADPAGLYALRALRAAGAALVGASPYITLLLGVLRSDRRRHQNITVDGHHAFGRDEYGVSGVMTFIVNHEGVVYQKDQGRIPWPSRAG